MILMKDIIREGHPALSKVSKPVELPISNENIKLGLDLLEYVKNSTNEEVATKYRLRPAVGIAAPQVNKLVRMFAVHFMDLDDKKYSYIVINPKIVSRSKTMTYLPSGEGCLSVDRDVLGLTPRNTAIHLTGYHLDPVSKKVLPLNLQLFGYASVVFQHEYDHLDGIMFTDKLFPDLPDAKPLFEDHFE